MESIIDEIDKIYHKLKNKTGGKNASYIPELKKVNPKLYGISIYTVNGDEYNIGDCNKEFALESCAKVFTLALALQTFGIKELQKKIGENKTIYKFNSVTAFEQHKTHTINSFHNGGAMATTSLLYDKNLKKFEKKILNNVNDFAGRKLHIDHKIYKSEFENVDHNYAIAYLLKSYNRFYGDVQSTVDVYTRQSSIMATTKDLAVMGATLANKGINPKTNKKIIDKKYVDYILKHMEHHGMYEESEYLFDYINIPSKSGVSGFLLLVVPGVMGIGIVSPPLNKHGNSVKGIKTAQLISNFLKI